MGVRAQIAGEGQVTKGLLVNSAMSLPLLLSVAWSHRRVPDGRGGPELWALCRSLIPCRLDGTRHGTEDYLEGCLSSLGELERVRNGSDDRDGEKHPEVRGA